MHIALDTPRECLYVSYLIINSYFLHFFVTWHIFELMCNGNQNTLYNASIAIVDNEQGLCLSHLKSIETLVIIPIM